MKRSIQCLKKILPVPETPVENVGDWDAVEERLGSKLPQDYKNFISLYGSGEISEWITVFTPFTTQNGIDLFGIGFGILSHYREYYPEPHPRHFPYTVYPKPGGLLTWGMTRDGDEFFWRTNGRPDRWDVVVHDRGMIEFYPTEGLTFGEYLLALLKCDSDVPLSDAARANLEDHGLTFEPFSAN